MRRWVVPAVGLLLHAATGQTDSEPAPPRPRLSVSASDGGALPQGWPLLVTVGVAAPAEDGREPTSTVTLTAATGPWSGLLRVEVTDAQGGAVAWPLQPAFTPTSTITLSATTSGAMAYLLRSDQTARLTPGEYHVRAVLEAGANAAPGSWTGLLRSNPARLTVVPAPSQVTPEQLWLQARLAAEAALWQGDPGAALRAAEDLVAAQPESYRALALRAEALAAAGQASASVWAYGQAVEAFRKAYPDANWVPVFATAMGSALATAGPSGAAPAGPTPAPEGPVPIAPTARGGASTAPADTTGPASVPVRPFNSLDPATQRQWAIEAVASSQYSTGGGAARQATGPPDSPRYEDRQTAWYPTPSEGGAQWLELTYRYPVVPSRIEIHENFGAGAVTRVAVLPAGAAPTAWIVLLDRQAQGLATRPPAPVITVVEAGAGLQPTRHVRVEVDTSVPGWNAIDAVALIGRFVVGPPNGSAGVFRWWAEAATASSQYGSSSNSARQATGPPDSLTPRDHPTAWAPGRQDGGLEWLEVSYAQPIVPVELIIYENCGQGCVISVEARDEQTGLWAVLWQGTDPTSAPTMVFRPPLSHNTFAARSFRIQIDTSVPGWNEIDAVELVGTPLTKQ